MEAGGSSSVSSDSMPSGSARPARGSAGALSSSSSTSPTAHSDGHCSRQCGDSSVDTSKLSSHRWSGEPSAY